MKRQYRSDTNKKLAGICGGIGEMTDTDPTIIRLIAVIAGVVTGIIPFVLAYIIAWWIVPPRKQEQAESRGGAWLPGDDNSADYHPPGLGSVHNSLVCFDGRDILLPCRRYGFPHRSRGPLSMISL